MRSPKRKIMDNSFIVNIPFLPLFSFLKRTSISNRGLFIIFFLMWTIKGTNKPTDKLIGNCQFTKTKVTLCLWSAFFFCTLGLGTISVNPFRSIAIPSCTMKKQKISNTTAFAWLAGGIIDENPLILCLSFH